jgi:hypothetical protein
MSVCDFLYYNAIGITTLVAGFVGLEYLSDSENFANNMRHYAKQAMYWSIDKTIVVKMLVDDLVEQYNEVYSSQHNTNIDHLAYDDEGSLCSPDAATHVFRKTKIGEDECFIEYREMDDINYRTSSPFIQVELSYNGEDHEIHGKLKHFYVVGHILDKAFFRAYVKQFYGLSIPVSDNDFTLKIVDHECNFKTITSTQKICIVDDGYELVECNE